MKKQDDLLEILEMARCVEVNLGNVKSMVPALNNFPMIKIVEMQIRMCIEKLEDITELKENVTS